MLSGVEVSGIVLAVLPLCITMIARYEDEIEPFISLFSYSPQLSKRRKELYCVHASFTKTIQNLCHNASVADSEQFDEMLKHSNAEAWMNDEAERKLQQFLSLQSYEAYRIEAVMICDSIVKVAGILGLDEKGLLKMEGMQGFRSDPWRGVASAKQQVGSTPQPTRSHHLLKKRLKFIFKGGQIGPLLLKIKDATRQLDELIGKSICPQAIVPQSVAATKRKEPFSRPLEEIKEHVRRLHRALHGVWSCTEHQSHCVNLRLEKRLHSDVGGQKEQSPFTIALMPSQKWRSFTVNVGEEPAKRTGRTVNFQTTHTTVPSGLAIIDDLCRHANARDECLPLHIDHQDQIFGACALPASNPTSAPVTAWATITLKDLLATSMRSEVREKQRAQLALTLVSSFLQLQSTPWLPKCWCADDVLILRSDTTLDVSQPFIRQTDPPDKSTCLVCPSDSDRIFALGTVLLQIATQTPIETWRTAAHTALEDLSIMRKCLREDAQWWPPCFAESIAACWDFLRRFDLDLNEPAVRREVIETMLVPFQRDLRW